MRLNIYICKTKYSSYKEYLFGLLVPRNAQNSHKNQSILQTFILCQKGNISQTFKSSSCKKSLSQVCISLIQLTSTNVFYSI